MHNQEIKNGDINDIKPKKDSNSSVSHILVIDDEPGFRALLSSELSRQGFNVDTASNGEEALEKVRRGNYDLAISDVKMPKLGGIEFLEAVKKENTNIEIIMATGFGTIETAVNAMKKGAYDFVQKPYNLPEVLALVEKALEKQELKAIIGVYEASKAVFSSIKLEKLLPIILQLTLKILKGDDAAILLSQPDGKIILNSSLGIQDEKSQRARVSMAERLAGKVIKEPVFISGPLNADDRFSGIAHLEDISSALVCPLEIDGHFLGILNINRTVQKNSFTSSDLWSTTIFGSQIAQAVFNAKLYLELEGKISELKHAYQQLEDTQSQLIQTEKLAAIGQLAAGVAHELNNPLTGILGFSQMILESGGLAGQQKEDIQTIFDQSKRCRDIIQNLLQFSRRKEPCIEPIKLNTLVEATLQLVKYDMGSSGISIQTHLPEDIPFIQGDASQLQQVFLNIFTNALHAMEEKGPGQLTIDLSHKGEKVTLKFKDTGPGISPELIGKVFDPFFTTKPVGKGTGLGLSISYGIIKQHQGEIRVESQKGEGTTFIIELPVYNVESPQTTINKLQKERGFQNG